MIRDEISLDEEEKLKILNDEGVFKNNSKSNFAKQLKSVNKFYILFN